MAGFVLLCIYLPPNPDVLQLMAVIAWGETFRVVVTPSVVVTPGVVVTSNVVATHTVTDTDTSNTLTTSAASPVSHADFQLIFLLRSG